MPVSERDLRYFRQIGELKAESHANATAAHLALPLSERLHRSWELYLQYRETVTVADQDDDPSPFYERARALGFYRG